MVLFEEIQKKIVSSEYLPQIRERYKGKTIVFCTGCYDVMHVGHAVFFDQCKQYGDILIVGVGRDSIIRELKGQGRPINPEVNRVAMVASLQQVDYAVLDDSSMINPGKIDFYEVISRLKPDVFVLNEGDSGEGPKRTLCEKLGIRLEIVPRIVPDGIKGTSSTNLIKKLGEKK